jgi:hypothetical protein
MTGGPAARGSSSARVEGGRIINVDIAHYTVDVKTMHTQRLLTDIQVSAPYLHFGSGEGIFAMPEVGAKVQVCFPSEGPPFVLCYVTAFEREGTPDGSPSTNPQTEEPNDSPTEVTFRAGRPRLQQGDIMLRCRDGNQIWLHRGGVVEIGSTQVCKRFYIPLLNTIRDFCENWEMLSAAGDLRWTVERAESSPDGDTTAYFTLSAKNLAQDQYATVFVQAGHVDDSNRFKMVIAPNAMDLKTGEVNGSSKFELTINEDGDLDVTIEGDVTADITGDLNLTVGGDGDVSVTGDLTETVGGDLEHSVSGNHKLTATSSEERLSSSKVIAAPTCKFGSTGAHTPLMLATPSMLMFLYHTHSVVGTSTGPPTPPAGTPYSQKLFGE